VSHGARDNRAVTSWYPPGQPPVVTTRPPRPVGRIVLGAVLVIGGVAWLLDATNAVDIPWEAGLCGALVLVGGTAAVVSRSRRAPALVTVGAVITALLFVTTVVDVPLDGGVGDRRVQVLNPGDLRDKYEMTAGSLVIDLRYLDYPEGTRKVTVRMAVGELSVIVNPDSAVEVTGRAGVGEIDILGRRRSGLVVDDFYRAPSFGNAVRRIELHLSVGVGRVVVTNNEVRR